MSDVLRIAGVSGSGGANGLPPAMVGDPYMAVLTARGGSGKYQWALVDPPAMPAWLTLDPTGVISGIPGRLAEGITPLTVQVDDGKSTTRQTFPLRINPDLRISRYTEPEGADSIQLRATGGSGSYTWEIVNGALPGWLQLDTQTGTIRVIEDNLRGSEVSQFTALVTDSAAHTDKASFFAKARTLSWWRRLFRRPGLEVSHVDVTIRSKRRWPSFAGAGSLTFWLGILALGVPIIGAGWIVVYAFTTPGSHGTYLGVAMLTAIAAFVIGCLIGFLFGIPRVVSSGQARLGRSSEYAPSSNLSEVSDWLTKLLIGAGLVQLTHLGAPISRLIDNVAAALHTTAAYAGAAKVTAGMLIFGYVAIGLLDGYVVTTMWYQRKLAQQDPGAAPPSPPDTPAPPNRA